MNKKVLLVVGVGAVLCVAGGLYFGDQYIWKIADRHFKKAEYQKTYELIKFLPKPQDTDRLKIYSQSAMAVGNYEKSKSGYADLYKETKDASYKLILGNIANQKSDYEEAIKIYEEVISLNPNYIQAYANLSTVYRIKGNNDKAIEIAERGISANSNSTILYELLVSLMQEKKDSPRYKEAVNKLKSLDPQNILLKQIGEI